MISVCRKSIRRLLLRMIRLLRLLNIMRRTRRRKDALRASRELDVNPSFVVFPRILKLVLPAEILDGRLKLRNVIGRVNSLPNNDVQMVFSSLLCCDDPLFCEEFGFLYVQPMKIDLIAGTPCIICSKDIVCRLFIILFHFATVFLPSLGLLVRQSTITISVGFFALCKTASPSGCFMTC